MHLSHTNHTVITTTIRGENFTQTNILCDKSDIKIMECCEQIENTILCHAM